MRVDRIKAKTIKDEFDVNSVITWTLCRRPYERRIVLLWRNSSFDLLDGDNELSLVPCSGNAYYEILHRNEFWAFPILRKNVGILYTLRNFAECCVDGINSTFSCLPRLISNRGELEVHELQNLLKVSPAISVIREKGMTSTSDNFVTEIARVPKFCIVVDDD